MHIPSNGRRRGGRRLTALAARWQIAAALLLVGLAPLFATTAQAQTVAAPNTADAVNEDGSGS